VVSARGESVGLACGALADSTVVAATDNASLGEPLPCAGRLAAAAALGHSAGHARAASDSVFGGEEGGGIAGLDAVAVVEGLGTAEGPAGAAIGLVANEAGDGGALGPGGADIEVSGDGGGDANKGGALQLGGGVAIFAGQDGAEHALHLGNGGVGETVGKSSLPGASDLLFFCSWFKGGEVGGNIII